MAASSSRTDVWKNGGASQPLHQPLRPHPPLGRLASPRGYGDPGAQIHDHKGGDSRFCHRTVLLSGVGAFAAGRDDHRISDQRGGVFKLAIIP
jgi:hypothetical protein